MVHTFRKMNLYLKSFGLRSLQQARPCFLRSYRRSVSLASIPVYNVQLYRAELIKKCEKNLTRVSPNGCGEDVRPLPNWILLVFEDFL